MSIWTTRSLDRTRNYIVLKHSLPGINNSVMGVKFRGSFAVVEKNSKTYYSLKKLPVLKKAQEFHISFLKELPFITRTLDIQTVYGKDVFNYFIEATSVKEKEEGLQEHLQSIDKCKYQTPNTINNNYGLCGNKSIEVSPSCYCLIHLLLDPKLKELGIEIPVAIPKKDRYQFKQKVINKLEKMKKEGLF